MVIIGQNLENIKSNILPVRIATLTIIEALEDVSLYPACYKIGRFRREEIE